MLSFLTLFFFIPLRENCIQSLTMGNIHVIDLHFLEESHAIASFLIETKMGPVLIETGPETTFGHLQKGVEKLGYKIEDIQHVFLTHIHFDHAGAAWKFAKHGAKIYVHPIGLPHLESPERLWNSAAQIYKEDMGRLWGNMEPIPKELLVSTDEGDEFDFDDIKIKVHYTPGHAIHHNVYQLGDIVFSGDVGGVKIGDGPVVPPCPPPDIHIENWKESIKKLRDLQPKALYLTHYSRQEQVEEHLNELEEILDDWAQYVKMFYDNRIEPQKVVPEFLEYTHSQFREKGLTEAEIQVYEYANPSWMSVGGLMRYWKLKEQGRI